MAISQGPPIYLSSAANIGTRLKAPAIAGQIADNAGGPIPPPGGVMLVQSTAALTNQVVTTSATGLQNASFVYISVSTGSLTGAAAPPYTGVGTPIHWNDAAKTLQVWSSGSGSWMSQFFGSSATAGFTTSA